MENRDKLWSTTGGGEQDLTEAPLPRLLALPTFVAEFLGKLGGSGLPYQLRTFITGNIDEEGSRIPHEKWHLLPKWCIAALQEKDGTSLLNIGSPEPALCQNPEFLEWCKHCLLITLGPETTRVTRGQAQGRGTGNLQMVERITTNMERSFLAGVQALAPTIAGAARQAGNNKDVGGDDVGGKLYSKNNVAALKGYCGVATPAGIPTI